MAPTAAERKPGNAGRRYLSSRRGKTKSLGLPVEFSPSRAGFDTSSAAGRVHSDAPHLRQINNQTAVASCVTGDVVCATTNRDQKFVPPRKIDHVHDISY